MENYLYSDYRFSSIIFDRHKYYFNVNKIYVIHYMLSISVIRNRTYIKIYVSPSFMTY